MWGAWHKMNLGPVEPNHGGEQNQLTCAQEPVQAHFSYFLASTWEAFGASSLLGTTFALKKHTPTKHVQVRNIAVILGPSTSTLRPSPLLRLCHLEVLEQSLWLTRIPRTHTLIWQKGRPISEWLRNLRNLTINGNRGIAWVSVSQGSSRKHWLKRYLFLWWKIKSGRSTSICKCVAFGKGWHRPGTEIRLWGISMAHTTRGFIVSNGCT